MQKKIIELEERRQNKIKKSMAENSTLTFSHMQEGLGSDLHELIKIARNLKSAQSERTKSFREFRKQLEAKLGNMLIDRKLLEPALFFCSMYVARLLYETAREEPKSWYAIDFLVEANESGNPFSLKEGGDMCFLLSSVFPERSARRGVKMEYYIHMGENFYYEFYNQTSSEIGYHMSNSFNTMAQVTQSCLDSL